MPVYYCAGTSGCQRLISVTQVPGGNAVALADPEGYASEWTFCSQCRAFTCDRCLARQSGRCKCGAGVRLYTEIERYTLAQGGPPVPAGAPAAAPAPPPAPAPGPPPPRLSMSVSVPAPVAAAGTPPLRQVMEGIVQMIDHELASNGAERARALATLAATLMVAQGPTAAATDLEWYMLVGEQFHRWQFFAEGANYWKGLYQMASAAGLGQSDAGMRIMASATAFGALAGEVAPGSPQAAATAAFVSQVFGPGHVLAVEVQARLGLAVTPPAPAAAPPIPMAPAAPQAMPALAQYDPATKNALWVTLAFMEMAMADGKVANEELVAWRRTMEKLRLPDVWAHFGTERLQAMLSQGVLAQLSSELAVIPMEKRIELAEILFEFMTADGRIDHSETEALDRITGWLGVSVRMPGH